MEKEEKGEENDEWQTTGSEYLGQRVKRIFTVKGKTTHTCGVIDGWLPKEINDGLALWHVKHDDGDDEDLELHEVTRGGGGVRKAVPTPTPAPAPPRHNSRLPLARSRTRLPAPACPHPPPSAAPYFPRLRACPCPKTPPPRLTPTAAGPGGRVGSGLERERREDRA